MLWSSCYFFPADVYHTTFDWPEDSEVAGRLESPEGYEEDAVVEKLVVYHRHISGILSCFHFNTKTINADQPKADVFSQGSLSDPIWMA